MQQTIFRTMLVMALATTIFTSCNKGTDAVPVDQELITTIKLTLTNTADFADVQTFTYKVDNGFNGTSGGSVRADTMTLKAGAFYNSSIQVLNEQANPVDDVTNEILNEQQVHLFLYSSAPATGTGALTFTNGRKDSAGKPFNLTGTVTAGAAGNGKLTVYLIHEPTNKEGITPAEAGGNTDAVATFPVRIGN